MGGKVFKESADIYQDQAKVLFDYYKSAAARIVAEETACEQEQADLETKLKEAQEVRAQAEKKAESLEKWTKFPLVIIGVFFAIKGKKQQLEIIENAERAIESCHAGIADVETRFSNIRRDYSVDKIGVVYVPIATRVPFGEKSFLIDHTESVENQSFQLPLLHQPESFQQSMLGLQETSEKMPIVEGNEATEEIDTSDYSLSIQNVTLHDYVGNLDRQVRRISYLLDDSDVASVDIPIIDPASEQAAFIKEHATEETDGKPIVEVFDADFEEKLEKLTQIDNSTEQFALADNTSSVDYMKKMMTQLAETVQFFSNAKNSGSSALMSYASGIMALVLKAGYTQYSPTLEAEEIERIRSANFDYQSSVNEYTPFTLKKSSRVRYDLISGSWLAEDGSRTAMPFGIHQVEEEVLQPVIEALMAENRVERLRIYANIEDQKRMYLDRWSSEIGNYFRDNRAACDELINRMRETYADYAAAYSMYQSLQSTLSNLNQSNEAVPASEGEESDEHTHDLAAAEVREMDSDAEMIAGFDQQAEECNRQQEQFAEYMDRIQDSINEMTDEFSHIEYYEASLRDSVSHDTAVAMGEIHDLTPRQKSLLGVSPYLAAFGKIPPEPNASDELMEDVQIDLLEEVRQRLGENEPVDA